MIIAIDGPAGAGKSSVALRVADSLGFTLVTTGALYRAVGVLARDAGVSLDSEAELVPIAAGLDVGFAVVDGENRVFVGGEDMSERLRTPEASTGASLVSAHPGVRDALVSLQRDFAERSDVVMEGRDIGTVIFPGAELKVFLTASAEERARRRCAEYTDSGRSEAYEAVLQEIVERDARDENREVAPLRPADDAVTIDATAMTVDEVVASIVSRVEGLSARSSNA